MRYFTFGKKNKNEDVVEHERILTLLATEDKKFD